MSLIFGYYSCTLQDTGIKREVIEAKHSALKRARAKVVPSCDRSCPEATKLPKRMLEEIVGHSLVRHRDRENRFLIFGTREQMAL